QRSINQACLTRQNQIAQNLSGRGRMHHPVPAKSVGQKKPWDSRSLAQNRVVIGRHLVKPRPCPLGIYRKIGETRHPTGSASQDLLDKRRVEFSLESWSLFGIVPGQQKAPALRPEVEAIRHVDDHWRGVGKLVEG